MKPTKTTRVSEPAFNHIEESARAARAAHARMLRGDYSGEALYVYYRTRHIEAFEGAAPAGAGWTLAWPERVPNDRTRDQLIAYFAARTGRLPYL